MESISYTLSTDQKVEFHIDDDSNLSWLSQFDSNSFNRMYMVIDDYIDEKNITTELRLYIKASSDKFYNLFKK